MIELDFDKTVHTVFAPVSELEKYYSLGVTALAGRGHRELKIFFKE